MPSRFQAPTPPVCRATKVTPAPSAATLFYRGAQRHLPEVHDLREYKWMFVRYSHHALARAVRLGRTC